MRRLNVAVVGCGFWGRNHARIYNDLESASLVAVADVNERAARALSERYGADSYLDSQDVFERMDVEAVSICTPTVTHAEIALAAIEAGKHVLVEKPMTDTVEEAERVVRAAEGAGVHLMVGFVERFNPGVIEAIRRVSKGEIGEVILARAHRVSRYPLRISDVGVVKDLSIHDVDIVRHLFASEPESIYATAGSIVHSFEDYANIIIRFRENRSAFIESNWLTPRKIRRLILTGSEGLITVEFITQEITVEDNERQFKPFLQTREPLTLELEDFVGSVLSDTPPKVSGDDGLQALRICEAALKSAELGKPVRIAD
ncbi:MAG: Gfo/Idh/MocA family oxidoreductase [Candidatus Bathyarchaeota archaeon]|nr:MAG: Gfo/Idh/MocA family oxidoreductase [Candidatus Bathyarchaeota archaeon]